MHPLSLQIFVFSFPGSGEPQDRAARDGDPADRVPDPQPFIRHPDDIPLDYRNAGARTGGLQEAGLGGLRFACREFLAPDTVLDLSAFVFGEQHRFRAQVIRCRRAGVRHEATVGFRTREDAFRARMVEQFCHIECYRRRVEQREGRTLSPDAAAGEWIERFAARFP